MAEQIDELFVKLGLQTDARAFSEAQNQFDGLKSRALQFGAAIGAGFGLNELTFGFAQATDRMAKFAETFSVTPQFVDELGFAFEQIGGTSDDAFSSIQRVADLIEQTEWGEIPIDAFREAGFDPYLLQGVTDIATAYERISEATQGLDMESARRALGALGFSNEEIRLFRQGPAGIEAMRADARALADIDQDMIEQAAAFQEATSRLGRALGGVADEISKLFVGDLADTLNSLADFLGDNRDNIADFADEALPILAGIASGIGALVAIQGGRAALGALANIPGATALAAGVGVGAFLLATEPQDDFDQKDFDDFRRRLENQGVIDRPEGIQETEDILEGLFPGSTSPGLSMRPDGGMGSGGIRLSYGNINVDARGSTDPAATGAAVERAIDQAMQRAAENTITDLQGVVG